MAKKTRPQIKASIVAKFFTNTLKLIKGDTDKDQFIDIADSFVSIDTDANVNGGYLQIDNTGAVDQSFIKKANPTGQFLRDDGAFADAVDFTEVTIDIENLDEIDLDGVTAVIINLISANPTEEIDNVINFTADRLYTFRSTAGLTVTFNDAAVNAGNLHLRAASLPIVGDKFGYLKLRTTKATGLEDQLFEDGYMDQLN